MHRSQQRSVDQAGTQQQRSVDRAGTQPVTQVGYDAVEHGVVDARAAVSLVTTTHLVAIPSHHGPMLGGRLGGGQGHVTGTSKSGRRPALRRIRRAASGAWETEPETAVVLLLSRSSSMLTSFQSLRICLTVLHAPSFSLLFFPAPSLAFARKLCRCVNPQRQFFRTWVRIGIHCQV